jgi:hypothetical protein
MSRTKRLYELLHDGLWHRTDEILRVVYGAEHLGIARIGALVDDLKRAGFTIEGKRDAEYTTLWWYRMTVPNLPKEPVQAEQRELELLKEATR